MNSEEIEALRENVRKRRGGHEFEEEGLACDVEMLCDEVERLTIENNLLRSAVSPSVSISTSSLARHMAKNANPD